MKTLAVICEQDIFADAPQVDTSAFRQRVAARAVVLDNTGRVALLRVANKGYHKLPGGGVDSGEDIKTALIRELQEEIGCFAHVIAELGTITEHRDQWHMTQQSHCYVAKLAGAPQAPAFTQEELDDGFEPIWADNLDAAIALLHADAPTEYDGQRIKPRDIFILQAAKSLLKKDRIHGPFLLRNA